eukprot:6079844-Pyramimonas_sp.AAC.1
MAQALHTGKYRKDFITARETNFGQYQEQLRDLASANTTDEYRELITRLLQETAKPPFEGQQRNPDNCQELLEEQL